MTLGTRILGALAGLPPATTRRITVERDLPIPLSDGTRLLADRAYADDPGGDQQPLILITTPYGPSDWQMRLFAERGFQALLVRCRGTFGSSGTFTPFRNDQRDGHEILAWIENQPWFPHRMGTVLISYCGMTQWAIAEDAPPYVKAMAPGLTTSDAGQLVYQQGALSLETLLQWLKRLETMEKQAGGVLIRLLRDKPVAKRWMKRNAVKLPLGTIDQQVFSRDIGHFQEWLEHPDLDDPWWEKIKHGQRLEQVPPMDHVSGWYDVFVRSQIQDFRHLRAAGRPARLTVGPWTHFSPSGLATHLRSSLEWMKTHLADQPPNPRLPVKVFVMGSKEWRELPAWPPAATPLPLYLAPAGQLGEQPSTGGQPSSYRYDSADPTPCVGGTNLNSANCGPKDQRTVEERQDVLTFTTDPLNEDITIMGDVEAQLYLSATSEHTDVFVRLCDVNSRGRSTNITDTIVRLRPGDTSPGDDGAYRVDLTLNPTAMTFLRGHRIRLQVASGAFPAHDRNPGTGEALAKATIGAPVNHLVWHDMAHPSAITLPVVR